MLSLNGSFRFFLKREYTDLRKGFDSLSGIVPGGLGRNPLSGNIFVFFNRRRNQVKMLHWVGNGFSIYYKRLEQGTYELPDLNTTSRHVELSSDSLLLILRGISLKNTATISRWCTNEMQPSLETLVEIAQVLHVDVRKLIMPTKS
jgi:transposase